MRRVIQLSEHHIAHDGGISIFPLRTETRGLPEGQPVPPRALVKGICDVLVIACSFLTLAMEDRKLKPQQGNLESCPSSDTLDGLGQSLRADGVKYP